MCQITCIKYPFPFPFVNLKKNEEDEKIIELNEEEEFTAPGFEELKTLETWVHLHPNIMSTGRISHYIPKGTNEEDAEELTGKLDEKEEALNNNIERLSPVNEDKVIYPGGPPKEDEDEENTD